VYISEKVARKPNIVNLKNFYQRMARINTIYILGLHSYSFA